MTRAEEVDSDEDLAMTATASASTAATLAEDSVSFNVEGSGTGTSAAGGAASTGRRKKWWHVSDDSINELVHSMSVDSSALDGVGSSSSQRSRLRARSKSSSSLGTSPLAASSSAALGARSGPGEASAGERSGTRERERSVRFDVEAETDAVDRMLQDVKTIRLSDPDALDGAGDGEHREEDEDAEKSWRVSDEQLLRHIVNTAAKVDAESQFRNSLTFAGQKLVRGSMLRSSSVPEAIAVRSAKGAEAARRGECKIAVKIFFVESGDTLVLKVKNNMKIGPPQAPKTNAFTEMFGLGASTKGFCESKKGYDFKRRQFGATQRPGWRPAWTENLKNVIAHWIDVDADKLRIYHKNNVMADELNLSDYGVADGETLTLSFVRSDGKEAKPQKDVTLSSSTKKVHAANWELRREQILSGNTDFLAPGFTLRKVKDLRRCNPGEDVWMMPKWVSQSMPNLFAPVGAGVTGDGSMKAPNKFEDMPIYLPDIEDSSLERVRTRVTGHRAYVTDFRPIY
eukprot:TRINITY_DN64246_c0_g1_i1.p1 TRINITY_DN64246_c0_g1~~TRINITY_DN64246_c0_g1_i1.p1  ORF type:complete len:579 (-),score=128.69 TRINITY_DN64246_c0_g1_i1:95-1633(-)